MADTVLYLTWQDERSRRWFPVGRLRRLPEGPYEFVYIRGYEEARQIAGMEPILGFMETDKRYLSDRLFPQFQNRIMSPNREDYEEYLRRLGFDETPEEPLEILARSEGKRATDSLQLIPAPKREEGQDGSASYTLRFFIHGMSHVRPEVQNLDLDTGTRLFLMLDFQNPHDPNAIMLRTEKNDLLGWLPRYYCDDLLALCKLRQPMEVIVERMTRAPVPSWLRILCRLRAPWPKDFSSFAAHAYQPLAGEG